MKIALNPPTKIYSDDKGKTMCMNTTLNSNDLYDFLKASGFEIGSTGGGCTAWMRDFPNACVMISSDSDHHFGSDGDIADCGIYVGVIEESGEFWHGVASNADDVPRLVALAMAKATNHIPFAEYRGYPE